MRDDFGSEASIRAWLQELRLERAEGTKVHQLRESVRPDRLFVKPEYADFAQGAERLFGTMLHDKVEGVKLQIFLVQHDWAAAFKDAQEFEGAADVRLPYPVCLFEFRVSGRRVALIANEIRRDSFQLMASVETPLGWCFLNLQSPMLAPLKRLMESQVRAICVALEAEVATSELIRAPHKLNAAREKRGKLPIPDFRAVVLSRRAARPLPLATSAEPNRRVRLHFRRGHWRHFETHKTWIKWTLVGDPDLGFIDKHYRL